MKTVFYAIVIVSILASCGNAPKKHSDEARVKQSTVYSFTLVEENIEKVRRKIDSVIAVRDVYTKRNLINKANEVIDETNQIYDYFDRWENKLIAASGGKNNRDIRHPEDTVVVTKLLVQQPGGDSLQLHITEIREIWTNLFRDTTGMAVQIPLCLEYRADRPATNWKANQFKGASVVDAIAIFEKLKYDARCSELVMLGKLWRAYRK